MTAKLVVENLKNKPMRSLLSILLIGVPVTLILSLVGLSYGMLEDSQQRTRSIGADVIIRPPNSSFLTLSGSMPIGLLDFFQQQPHVKLAIGTISYPVQGVTLGAQGIDLAKYDQMNGGFKFISGGPFRGSDEVIIDDYYARQKDYKVGDHIPLLNRTWRVCGIIRQGQLARIVFPLNVLQDLTGQTNKITQIFLKLDKPANTDAVVKTLKEKMPDYPIMSVEEFLSLFSVNNIPGLKEFVWVIISIGVVIGFAVVCLSMYMAVLQRTREIGILKSMGGSNGFILRIVVAEALIMGAGGTVLGIIMSYGVWWLIRTLIPASIQLIIVYSWWPIALVITLVGAGLGALYPGIAAARHDPIEALAYE